MNKLFWQTVKVTPVFVAASLFAAGNASAQTISADKEVVNGTLEQINNYQQLKNGNLPQVTNVNQLRDVSPTDWAYEALRSLVDRYGCISGFPNQTYRGNQPLSRYEFAAGLNSCLNQIERLIASQEGGSQEDIDTINRLTQEFEAELATIGGRVDEIESRTATLEDSQFSTTTILKGNAIFALSDAFGGGSDLRAIAENNLATDEDDDVSDEEIDAFLEGTIGDLDGDGDFDDDDIDEAEDETEIDAETTFSSRVRLDFDTSFFGEDRLRTRLEGGNIGGTAVDDDGEVDEINLGDVAETDSARLGFDTNNSFDVEITDLHYRFPVGEKIRAWVGPLGLDLDDIFAVTNPMLESSNSGALSRFSRRNPVLFRGTESAGAGVNFELIEDKVSINALYLTDNAQDPSQEAGLFNGSFSAGAQLEVSPIEPLELTATYVRNYQLAGDVNQSGSTVSGNATVPFTIGDGDDEADLDTIANKVGLGANLEVGEKIVLAGWGGYADVSGIVEGDNNNTSGQIWTWGANVSLLDLVKEGSQLSLAGGMVPKFISDLDTDDNQAALGADVNIDEDPDTSYLVEALYKFPLSDNVEITPGVYAVFNPNHQEANDTVVVGAVRTRFKF